MGISRETRGFKRIFGGGRTALGSPFLYLDSPLRNPRGLPIHGHPCRSRVLVWHADAALAKSTSSWLFVLPGLLTFSVAVAFLLPSLIPWPPSRDAAVLSTTIMAPSHSRKSIS